MMKGGLRAEVTAMLDGAPRGLSARELVELLHAGRGLDVRVYAVEGELMALRDAGRVTMQHEPTGRTYSLRN